MLRVAVFALLAVAASAGRFDGITNCQDCVAQGYGWCPKARRCGGFATKGCSGTETDTRRSPEEEKEYLAKIKAARAEKKAASSEEAAAPAAGGAGDVAEEDGVLVATGDNFDAILAAHDNLMVEFYAPWCGHCKRLAPEYVKAAKILADAGAAGKLAKVDATANRDLAKKFGVRGYPTLIPFKSGEKQDKYSGGRTADDIADFMQGGGGSSSSSSATAAAADPSSKVIVLTDTNFNTVLNKHDHIMVEFYAPWCGHCKKLAPTYEKAAKKLAELGAPMKMAKIDATEHKETAEKFGITGFPSLLVFKPGSKGANSKSNSKYTGKRTMDGILKHMYFEAGLKMPKEEGADDEDGLVLEMTWDTADDVMKHEVKQQVLVCNDFSDPATKKELKEAMAEAADELNGQFLFLYLDSTKSENAPIIERVGGRLSACPALRLATIKDKFSAWLPYSKQKFKHNKAGLVKFVTAWSMGKLRRHLQSEAVPPPSDEKQLVTKIVGSTFKAVVMGEEEKDVMFFSYMRGCNFCKEFSKAYDEVAAELEGQNVLFTKVNGPRNDIDHPHVQAGRYPTVYLFPAGDMDNPVQFEETHEGAEALREFISMYATNEVVLPEQ